MSIVVHHLSYIHPDREELFTGISFSIASGEKASLTGDNGCGKSTLVRILAGQLPPSAGNYSLGGRMWYVPQHFGQYDSMTVAEALGVAGRLHALEAISAGSTEERHYTILDDDWTVDTRAWEALESWGLADIDLSQRMDTLSGGGKTKVFLSGIALHDPEVVLMDEPTNHLDAGSRTRLRDIVSASRATMLIVSHDRSLLNTLDTTFEMSSSGITRYGGNYDHYRAIRDGRQAALLDRLGEKERALRTAEQKARQAMERKQRTDSRAPKNMEKEGVPRIMRKTIADRAADTSRRLAETHAGKTAAIRDEARELRGMIAPDVKMKVALRDAAVHEGKIMAEARDINFRYPGGDELWPDPLSLIIRSGERIAVGGANGTGKTTLLRILLGETEPTSGTIFRAPASRMFIDQEYSLIDGSLTVLGQLERWNRRNLPGDYLRTELHRFLFPVTVWDKPCTALSGGERLRLTLCCMEVADDSPALLALDEPANNLDIRNTELLATAVSAYRGTLLVISHDPVFLAEAGVTRRITLERQK